MAIKVLLDTDIGSSIDDAVCLSYLLTQPECELLGITTVSGGAEKRAMLASVLCNVAAKRVPIFPGAEAPLLVSQKQPDVPHAIALQKWTHEKNFPRGHAVDFLRQTIHEHPKEVVLLAIGPLTNIALLFTLDPEIPLLLKGLVLMCGIFTNRVPGWGPREWNAMLDPHAAAIVYQAPIQSHRSIGLDVTTQLTISSAQAKEKFAQPLFRPVLDMAEVWFEENDVITFHDPLAAATIFDDSICRFSRGKVEIELTSERLAGVTYWNTLAEDSRHQVALEVDSNSFFKHYFGVLGCNAVR